MEPLVRRLIESIPTRDVRAASGPTPSGLKNKERNNTMKTVSKITLAAAALALLGIAAALAHGDKGKHSDARWKTLVIDVAEDARTASLNTASPTDTGPKRGATAISNGKIYPGA